MSSFPFCFCSSAALAAIQANMPMVMGQPIVALCFLASAARISFMVVTLPVGIFLIISSTSTGAGITTVPFPQRLLIFSVIFSTLGNPLFSFSFSHQVFFLFVMFLTLSNFFVNKCLFRLQAHQFVYLG